MSAKRGPYRRCYLVPHRTGFKYCRAVPKDLQPTEGKQAWVKYLGPVSRAVAETMAHALAYEHGRRILALRGEKFELNPLLVRAPPLASSPPWDAGAMALKLMDLVGYGNGSGHLEVPLAASPITSVGCMATVKRTTGPAQFSHWNGFASISPSPVSNCEKMEITST